MESYTDSVATNTDLSVDSVAANKHFLSKIMKIMISWQEGLKVCMTQRGMLPLKSGNKIV